MRGVVGVVSTCCSVLNHLGLLQQQQQPQPSSWHQPGTGLLRLQCSRQFGGHESQLHASRVCLRGCCEVCTSALVVTVWCKPKQKPSLCCELSVRLPMYVRVCVCVKWRARGDCPVTVHQGEDKLAGFPVVALVQCAHGRGSTRLECTHTSHQATHSCEQQTTHTPSNVHQSLLPPTLPLSIVFCCVLLVVCAVCLTCMCLAVCGSIIKSTLQHFCGVQVPAGSLCLTIYPMPVKPCSPPSSSSSHTIMPVCTNIPRSLCVLFGSRIRLRARAAALREAL